MVCCLWSLTPLSSILQLYCGEKVFLFREGYVQTAYSSLLQAGDYNLPEVFVEKAKWFWHKGDKDQALTCLERGMSVHFPDINKLKSDESDRDKTKLKIYAQVNIPEKENFFIRNSS
jgi:hypothetical protein